MGIMGSSKSSKPTKSSESSEPTKSGNDFDDFDGLDGSDDFDENARRLIHSVLRMLPAKWQSNINCTNNSMGLHSKSALYWRS